jgi:hypothetical protein
MAGDTRRALLRTARRRRRGRRGRLRWRRGLRLRVRPYLWVHAVEGVLPVRPLRVGRVGAAGGVPLGRRCTAAVVAGGLHGRHVQPRATTQGRHVRSDRVADATARTGTRTRTRTRTRGSNRSRSRGRTDAGTETTRGLRAATNDATAGTRGRACRRRAGGLRRRGSSGGAASALRACSR